MAALAVGEGVAVVVAGGWLAAWAAVVASFLCWAGLLLMHAVILA